MLAKSVNYVQGKWCSGCDARAQARRIWQGRRVRTRHIRAITFTARLTKCTTDVEPLEQVSRCQEARLASSIQYNKQTDQFIKICSRSGSSDQFYTVRKNLSLGIEKKPYISSIKFVMISFLSELVVLSS